MINLRNATKMWAKALAGLGRVLGLTFVAQVIIQMQGLIVMPIIVRSAGPATYGAYVILFVTTVVFFELATWTISFPYVRNLVSASSAAERRRLFEPQITFCLAVFALISAGLLVAHPLTMEIGTGTSILTILLVGILAVKLLQRQGLDYFRYTLRFTPYSLILGGSSLVFMVLLVTYVALGRVPSLDALLIFQCLAGIGVSFPFLVRMLSEIGVPRLHLPPRLFITNMRASLPVTFDGLVSFLLGFSDRYLISMFLSVAAVGEYQPSYQAAAIIFFFAGLLYDVLSPVISKMIDLRQRADAELLVTNAFRLFLMLAIPFIVGMLMVGPPFLGLLTTQEIATSGRWVMPLVAMAVTVNAFTTFMRLVAMALNRLPTILAARLTGAAVNVALNLLLLPMFADISAAAMSILAGYLATSFYLAISFRSDWRLPFELGATLRFCGAAALMGLALWVIGYRPATAAPESVLHLAGVIGAAILIYFLALHALGGLVRRDVMLVADIVQSGFDGNNTVRS
jgi:O-antigen/teichoic acid export membrane protein